MNKLCFHLRESTIFAPVSALKSTCQCTTEAEKNITKVILQTLCTNQGINSKGLYTK